MPDLGAVLAGLGDDGARIFQATVDAVGVGVVTVRANGGTFADVPYLSGAFYPQAGPEIGDACYVIGQENWGQLVIGKPAPGPERPVGGGGEVLWDPSAIGVSQNSGGWTVPFTDAMPIQPGSASGSAAVYFYDLADIVWPGGDLASASFYLEFSEVQMGEVAVEHVYVTIGLHSTDAPGGTFTELVNLNGSHRQASSGVSHYVSIPLDWAGRLLSGEAKGIFVRTEDYPLTVSGPGTLRLTEL